MFHIVQPAAPRRHNAHFRVKYLRTDRFRAAAAPPDRIAQIGRTQFTIAAAGRAVAGSAIVGIQLRAGGIGAARVSKYGQELLTALEDSKSETASS